MLSFRNKNYFKRSFMCKYHLMLAVDFRKMTASRSGGFLSCHPKHYPPILACVWTWVASRCGILQIVLWAEATQVSFGAISISEATNAVVICNFCPREQYACFLYVCTGFASTSLILPATLYSEEFYVHFKTVKTNNTNFKGLSKVICYRNHGNDGWNSGLLYI